MSCAKMAEPIEIQFGTLSWAGSGNMYYIGIDTPTGRGIFESVWPFEKHGKAYDLGVD